MKRKYHLTGCVYTTYRAINSDANNLILYVLNALSYAETQIENMKTQFAELFDELNALIQEKYTELEELMPYLISIIQIHC